MWPMWVELTQDYAGLKDGMQFPIIDWSYDAVQLKSGLWVPNNYIRNVENAD